jgi:hypothetical protein
MPSLTYADLAQTLRITPESANRLARRKRWPRVKGNDGRTRVYPRKGLSARIVPRSALGTDPRIVPRLPARTMRFMRRSRGWKASSPECAKLWSRRWRGQAQRRRGRERPRLGRARRAPRRRRPPSPPSNNWRSGSKQWPPSAPSSRGGRGFSGGPDEAHQPSGNWRRRKLSWRVSGWCSLTSSWTATNSGRSGTIGMRSG